MNTDAIINIIKNHFRINPIEVKELWGYENLNYHIKTENEQFVLKTYKNSENLHSLIKAENDVLLYLKNDENNSYPEPIEFSDRSYSSILDIDGEQYICRLLTFLEGSLLGDIKPTKEIFRSLGKFIAQLDRKLLAYNNKTIKARKWHWDIQHLALNKDNVKHITDPSDRKLVKYFIQQFDMNVIPELPELRHTIIHGDANEWNLLVDNNQVTGIIDFGDLVYSPLINELAITISYACLYVDEPVDWATIIVESYHKILPLEEKEIKILYYLIVARLCISVINSAVSRNSDTKNTYAQKSEKQAWKALNKWLEINPIALENKIRPLLKLKTEKQKSIKTMVSERRKFISPALSLSYSKPIHMVKSAFQYMYDAEGKTYLDAYNNIPHVGHCHPAVVSAGQEQMAKLNTNTRYIYDLLAEYSEKLLLKFPEELNKIYFVNSGSAASDLAIRLAKAHTGFNNILVIEHGYHGNTQIGIDISDYKFNNKYGQGQKEYIFKAKIPDTYRGKYTDEANAGISYAKDAVENVRSTNQPIAAFISEPILGCAGQVPLAKGYLKYLYPAIKKLGGVCISDEVQTGFGRLGTHFWGFEKHEVIPDIVILGKPIGNGHPIGAVVTTTKIAESFDNGVEFFSSFGGNPVSCAIGLSVLNVIKEEKLQENALDVGAYYKSLLIELQTEFDCIGDVRGSGLFIGVDIVMDNTKNPDTKLANEIKNILKDRNVLISTDGPNDNVLKSKPPLCFNKKNAEQVVDEIRAVLRLY